MRGLKIRKEVGEAEEDDFDLCTRRIGGKCMFMDPKRILLVV